MSRQKELLAHLLDAFPPTAFCGEVVSRHSPEHSALCTTLSGATWWSIPGTFIQEHACDLALLTKEAYQAFLPAWLGEAVSEPSGEVATFLMRNLKEGSFASEFSHQASYAVVQVVKWIAERDGGGSEDFLSKETVAVIIQKWGHQA